MLAFDDGGFAGSADSSNPAELDSSDSVTLARRVGSLRMPETITVVRKKKEKVLVPSDFLVGQMRVQGDALEFTLEAKKTGSLRPDVLLEAMLEGTGLHAASIMRIRQRETAGE